MIQQHELLLMTPEVPEVCFGKMEVKANRDLNPLAHSVQKPY